MSRRGRGADLVLGLVTALVLLVLYAPVLLVALFSVVPYERGRVVWGGATLAWYAGLLRNADILGALRQSLAVGAVAVVLALLLGGGTALWAQSGRAPGRRALELVIFLPFLLLPIITGLSLLIFFRDLGLERGLPTVVAGHTAFLMALCYRLLLTRLEALPGSLVEASYDLGASGWQTFRHVLWPQLRTAAVTAGLLAFTLSLDETLITVFLVGDGMTLPIRLWAMMRVGFTPEVNALVTLVLLLSTAVTLAVGLRLARGRGAAAGEAA